MRFADSYRSQVLMKSMVTLNHPDHCDAAVGIRQQRIGLDVETMHTLTY
jgi:hypothetical protein